MKLLLRWVISACALLLATEVVPGFEVENFYFALVAAFVLGLLNAIVRPVLFLLTLPVNLVTLGLFTFVINGVLIWFMSTFIEGVHVDGLVPAIAVAIIVWAISTVTNWMLKEAKDDEE